jgi:polyhydroxyalkanoate synthase
MPKIRLDPDHARRQLAARQKNLHASLANLSQLDSRHRGAEREEIFATDTVRLYHYRPTRAARTATPLLICYALVNRPWVLDLSPERSLIQRLLDEGIPVYLIDWGYPTRSDRFLELEDYLEDYLDRCVDRVLHHSQRERLNLAGVCQGGVLSLCYSALHPDKVSNLITLVTPVDSAHPGFRLGRLTAHIDLALAASAYGNLPGPLLNEIYQALKPMRLGLQKRLQAGNELGGEPERALNYLLMERWLNDCPDLASAALQEFVQLFMHDNALMRPEGFELAGKTLRMRALQTPLLNIFGLKDDLVPAETARALRQATDSPDYTELAIAAGHIGTLTGRNALNQVPSAIAQWLRQRDGDKNG